jgi:hypothetical protein
MQFSAVNLNIPNPNLIGRFLPWLWAHEKAAAFTIVLRRYRID